jgi:hypothetical protein
MNVPYLLRKESTEFEFIRASGERFLKSIVLHQPGIPRNLKPLNQELSGAGILKGVSLGKGWVYRIHGRAFMKHLCDRLTRDPEFLVSDAG